MTRFDVIFSFCIYESGDFRERKLNKNEKPLSVQSHWSSGGPYQRFVLRRATRSVSNQVSTNSTSLISLSFCNGLPGYPILKGFKIFYLRWFSLTKCVSEAELSWV